MQIAEHILQNGMAAQNTFKAKISDFVAERKITRVVETGTYHGTGTTMAVVDGLTKHGLEFDFYSFEVNPEHWAIAKRNVPRLRGIHILNELSIPADIIQNHIDYDSFPADIIVDHVTNREQKYFDEVNYRVPSDALGRLIDDDGFFPELLILDSAGHIGFIEYQYVTELMHEHEYYLFLDDTRHIKHYHSVQDLKQNPDATILWETDEKFGSLLAHVKPVKN